MTQTPLSDGRPLLSLTPTGSTVHGSRSRMTCFYRCGNACDHPEPNTSDAGHVRDEIAKAVAAKAKPKARKSGISAARKRYTDARKTKLASLRAHRDKLVREHKAKTKKMPKKERDALRREFRKKVDSQYKEQVKKFPTARGMNDPRTVLGLIKRLESARI